jgi:site-specific DNA-cytosine methylase
MKIGLRVNKGDKEYVSVAEAVLEIGIGGGQIASTLTCKEPSMSAHHTNFVLEGSEDMKIKNATNQGYLECPAGGCFDGQFPDSKDRRGRVQEGGNVTPTITAEGSQQIYYNENEWRIRKLTPKECYRLMGYHDTDYEKAISVNSGTQLYKQAGNAIVKQVLMAIFLQLGIQGKKKWNDMTAEEKQALIKNSIL